LFFIFACAILGETSFYSQFILSGVKTYLKC
jgi:hypothetical protein